MKSIKKYKTVIVEDEVNNLKLLEYFIAKYCPEIEICATAESIIEAKNVILKIKPDIVFLDVVLKNELVFELFDFIDPKDFQIVFTTAYNKYAIQAFRVNAIDYLTKPIDINLLVKAVKKAVTYLENNNYLSKRKMDELKESNDQTKLNANYISIASKTEVSLIKYEDIMYLSSIRKYTVFHVFGRKEIVSTKNIGFYEENLNDKNFYRIHNSYIINLNFLADLKKLKANSCSLITGQILPVARRRFKELKQKLNIIN